jgi:hypothetical protein
MPSVDFDAMRANIKRREDPYTFKLCGRVFITVPSPTVKAVFDLMDAPEVEPASTNPEAVRACSNFIRRMLATEADRLNWDAVLDELHTDETAIVIRIAVDLAQQYAFRPTVPSDSSSNGHLGTGSMSNQRPGGEVGREH